MQEHQMDLLVAHSGTLEAFRQAHWEEPQLYHNSLGINQHMVTGLDTKCMLQIILIQAGL